MLTAAQVTAFFQGPDQMGVTAATRAQSQVEGIDTVSDLADLDEESFKQMWENVRAADQPLGAKSQRRLSTAISLLKYYATVGRPLTAGNVA